MTTLNLHQTAQFIFNKSIDDVAEIYKGKVPGPMLEHLIDKARYYKSRHDNSSAWLYFILNADNKNQQVLVDYIKKQRI